MADSRRFPAAETGGGSWDLIRSGDNSERKRGSRLRPSSLDHAQKATARGVCRCREGVVERVIQREQDSQIGSQPLLHFGPNQRLLILLLGLVPATVERV